MIIFENADVVVTRASHRHPGLDSAITLAQCGDVIVGHIEVKAAAVGADCFGSPPLCVVAVCHDEAVVVMYTYGWRWSEAGQRNVLGWWFGDGEWDVAAIQAYGPVLA